MLFTVVLMLLDIQWSPVLLTSSECDRPYSTLLPGPWAATRTAVGTASWESHPRQDLCRPPSLRDPIKGLGLGGSIIIGLTGSWHSSFPKLPAGDGCALAAFIGRHLMELCSTGGSWRIPGTAFPFGACQLMYSR